MNKQYLEKRDIPNINHQGVFTTVQLPSNLPVLEFGGDFFTKENLKHEPKMYLQVGPNLYLGPSGKIDDYVRHSCSPNCGLSIVGGRAILYSMYIIQPNTEITFDYSTSSTESRDEWTLNCLCGKANCRKKISGYQYLSAEERKLYQDKDVLPLFIKEKIFT